MDSKKGGMRSDRLMNRIRNQGQTWLLWFMIIFVVSVFAGLGGQYYFSVDRSRNAQGQQGAASSELKTMAVINDTPFKSDEFYRFLDNAQRNKDQQKGYSDSPLDNLELMNQVVESAIYERAIKNYGKAHNITVSETEVRQEIEKDKARFSDAGSSKDKPTTILGEIRGSLKKGMSGDEKFHEWLSSQNITQADYFSGKKDELLLKKCTDDLNKTITDKKKAMVDSVKKTVDAQLSKGTDFASLTRLFSFDFFTRDGGGEIPSDLGLGFMSDTFDKNVFKLEKPGDVTPWYDTEFGFEKVQLIEKKPLVKDKKLDEIKDELKKTIRKLDKKDDKYEPTDDELKWAYEAKYTHLRVRHMTLSTSASMDSYLYGNKLLESTPYKIDHPFVRGYRAMKGKPNEQAAGPVPELDIKLYLAAEDFGVLENGTIHEDRIAEAVSLLKNGKGPKAASWYKKPEAAPVAPPAAATKVEGEKPAAPASPDGASKAPEASTDAQPGAKTPETAGGAKPAAADNEGDQPYKSVPPDTQVKSGPPRYKEAVDAFTEAKNGPFKDQAVSHYCLGWCWQTWSEDVDHKKEITIKDADLAKIITDEYKAASDANEYEPVYYLALAEFLSGRGDNAGAAAAADKAFEYVGLNTDNLTKLNGLYTKLGNTAKAQEVSAKLAEAKSREQQPGQSSQMPITVNGGGAGQPIKVTPQGSK